MVPNYLTDLASNRCLLLEDLISSGVYCKLYHPKLRLISCRSTVPAQSDQDDDTKSCNCDQPTRGHQSIPLLHSLHRYLHCCYWCCSVTVSGIPQQHSAHLGFLLLRNPRNSNSTENDPRFGERSQMLRSPMRGAVVAVLIVSAARPSTCFSVGGGLTGAGITAFLGWAFQGVGPSQAAKATIQQGFEPETVGRLNALLFGGPEPVLALFCGAKIRRESYAPLAQDFLEQLGRPEAGVLILQSPFNIYAFKPSSVTKVLNEYPSVECVAGHSIGGLWAAEFCRDLHAAGDWPSGDLSFFHMGVHGKGVSLKPFKELPFRRVGWSYASEDCTLLRAAGGAQAVAAYVARACETSCRRIARPSMRFQAAITSSMVRTAHLALRRALRTRAIRPRSRRRSSAASSRPLS